MRKILKIFDSKDLDMVRWIIGYTCWWVFGKQLKKISTRIWARARTIDNHRILAIWWVDLISTVTDDWTKNEINSHHPWFLSAESHASIQSQWARVIRDSFFLFHHRSHFFLWSFFFSLIVPLYFFLSTFFSFMFIREAATIEDDQDISKSSLEDASKTARKVEKCVWCVISIFHDDVRKKSTRKIWEKNRVFFVQHLVSCAFALSTKTYRNQGQQQPSSVSKSTRLSPHIYTH